VKKQRKDHQLFGSWEVNVFFGVSAPNLNWSDSAYRHLFCYKKCPEDNNVLKSRDVFVVTCFVV